MTDRIELGEALPTLYKHQLAMNTAVKKAAADAGVDARLLELVKIRASQLNGCAFCLDMHAVLARELGETERRLYLLGTWREAGVYSDTERAALALTDAMTTLPATQDVPDDVYEQATTVFTGEQYAVVAWAIAVINTFNRINVTSRKPVPA